MKNIILVLALLMLCSCVTQVPEQLIPDITEPTTTVPTFVCNKPYIQVGSDCCLDENDNSICDTDETAEVSNQAKCDISIPFNCRYAEISKDNIHLSLKYITQGNIYLESISFPSLGCSKYFYNVPKDQWIYDPLTDYSKVEPLKETAYDIPCEITGDYVNTDLEIKYIIYNDGVPFGEIQRYLYSKDDVTYGTLEGEI